MASLADPLIHRTRREVVSPPAPLITCTCFFRSTVLPSIATTTSGAVCPPMRSLAAAAAILALSSGEKGFQDDVYVATSEPAGTISCTVNRE